MTLRLFILLKLGSISKLSPHLGPESAAIPMSKRLSSDDNRDRWSSSLWDRTFQVPTRRDHLRLTQEDHRLADDTSAPPWHRRLMFHHTNSCSSRNTNSSTECCFEVTVRKYVLEPSERRPTEQRVVSCRVVFRLISSWFISRIFSMKKHWFHHFAWII